MPTTSLNPRWLSGAETTNQGIFIHGNHLRGLPLEGYIILYRANDDGIEIVCVANGR
jgi:hypothetical protein